MRYVVAFLAAASLSAMPVAPVSSAPLFPQPQPSPQGPPPTAEKLVSLRQRAESGDGDAQHALGTLYLVGQGVPMDRAEALKWFGLEAARASGDKKRGLCTAFDSLADTVAVSTLEEAFMRARRWEADYSRRSPALAKRDTESLWSVFGAILPRLVREVKPSYTMDAMRRLIQGTVEVDCFVVANGRVEGCQVGRSLDSIYGLDEEALTAARRWRFTAGTIRGKPARVLVTIDFAFKLK